MDLPPKAGYNHKLYPKRLGRTIDSTPPFELEPMVLPHRAVGVEPMVLPQRAGKNHRLDPTLLG